MRVGELWRRIVAKRLAHDLRQAAQAIFLNARQFGIAMPCGTDALVHFRATLEEALRADDNEALAVLDLDLRNAFPSLEWDAIRASVARHMPSLLPWITWSHGQPSPVHLPSGGVKWVDRGAEQGDPLGSILCGLVVIDVMIRTRARVQKCLEDEDGYAHLSHDVVLRLFDAWFMDDGQVVLAPNLVDLFLRAACRVSRPAVAATATAASLSVSSAQLCTALHSWGVRGLALRQLCGVFHRPISETEHMTYNLSMCHA